MRLLKFILLGFYFGFILLKSEAVSWYRIVEMFRFQSFHMYGVIVTAIVTGIVSILVIKATKLKTVLGDEIVLPSKPKDYKANFIGGIFFGLGWSIVGACTAPLFIHLGLGNTIVIVPLIGAFFGALLYGIIKQKLPH